MSEEMIELYKKLSNNEKRNEFSSLFVKTDKLLDELLTKMNLPKTTHSKNYDKFKDSNKSEEEMLLFFYEDLWNIKDKVLMLLISENK